MALIDAAVKASVAEILEALDENNAFQAIVNYRETTQHWDNPGYASDVRESIGDKIADILRENFTP